VRVRVVKRQKGKCKNLDGNCLVNITTSTCEIDHIHEVADGGGGMGMSNYQALCKPCHRFKTKINITLRHNDRLSTN
jgi:5-methylcytosine-specific restriction endonuclease McrA